jgi:hypothetical protein
VLYRIRKIVFDEIGETLTPDEPIGADQPHGRAAEWTECLKIVIAMS